MRFLSTLEHAIKSLEEVEKQLETVAKHSRRMGGNADVIPFNHNDEGLRKRYSRYAKAVYDLREKMRSMEHRLPENTEFKNILGWALAFDEISRG